MLIPVFCIVVHVAPLNLDDRVNAEHMRQQLWAPAMAAAMEAHQPPVADDLLDAHDDHVSFSQIAHCRSRSRVQRATILTCRPGVPRH